MSKILSFIHYTYSFTISVVIFAATFTIKGNLRLIIITFLIPLLLYFLAQSYKGIYLWQYQLKHPVPQQIIYSKDFNIFHFITQENEAFLITFSFLIIYLTLTILKAISFI